MSEIDDLIKIAQEGVEPTRELNEIEEFFKRFEMSASDTSITPFWAIYRCYRITTPKPLSRVKFRLLLSKYFRKADKSGRYLSYFCNPGKLDVSDAGRKAEDEFNRTIYQRQKREEKERNKDKPWVKYRSGPKWKQYKAGEIK
jgi:hypothetical protein